MTAVTLSDPSRVHAVEKERGTRDKARDQILDGLIGGAGASTAV